MTIKKKAKSTNSKIKSKKPVKKLATRKPEYEYLNSAEVAAKIMSRKDCHIVAFVEGRAAVVKKVALNVQVINTNAVFQPYEKMEQKTCLMFFIIEWMPNDRAMDLSSLKALGCPVHRVESLEKIDVILDAIR